MSNNDTKKELKVDVVVVIVLIVVLFFLAIFFLKRIGSEKKILVRPTPPPIANPLPTGEQYFNVSYGDMKSEKPKLEYIYVNTLNPSPGSPMKFRVKLQSPFQIQQFSSVLYTDTKKRPLLFQSTSNKLQNDEWSASWTANDTYNNVFKVEFHIVNEGGILDDGIAFR